MSLELEREHKALQARYDTALHRIHRLEEMVSTLEDRLKVQQEEAAKLRRTENVELWERERAREREDWAARERELREDIAQMTDQLEKQKAVTQKTMQTLQIQVKKSEMKAGIVHKMSEDEYYTHVDNFRKDILQQKMLTAKREKARKNQLDIFVGIVRGLRLDFRILMEVLNTEVKSLLGVKDDLSPCPLKCFPRFLDLMAILDDVQYSCSGDKIAQLMSSLPAHYSSLEEGLKLAASSTHSNSYSTPNSPVATPTRKPKEKGSPLAHARSLTTPSREQILPPLQSHRSARTCHALSSKESAPSSLPGSPLHSRKLPVSTPMPKPLEPSAGVKSTADIFGLSPRQPRRIVATKSNLKMAVVSPNLRSVDKVLSLHPTDTPLSDKHSSAHNSAEQ